MSSELEEFVTPPICPPDLSARPYRAIVDHPAGVPAGAVFRAWTERFDQWFAQPGEIVMRAEVNAPYFFQTFHEGRRHPHYGRFLRVDPGRLIELTWLNEAGTRGVETVLTVETSPRSSGSLLRLTHAGFPDDRTREEHETAWRSILLDRLDPVLRGAET
ncbi:uncharacterized protein YndB with AHSA1/START domain [Actinomadura luteofluorescens]|uniref:Uncharacterized protein YndB with AHSA1/START domain n=1 Tax=Actinomadura luteofluorescens TaxID=46163 RepID=A0A7Y9JKM4_9ACTN|nr:SRPBCC family protein [Actinomadura luteofluorescens]NYD52495.1 uncharacterized protein YndB with AHSA1/START domain [Actinomadura luteofluorescens]